MRNEKVRVTSNSPAFVCRIVRRIPSTAKGPNKQGQIQVSRPSGDAASIRLPVGASETNPHKLTAEFPLDSPRSLTGG